MSQQPLAPPRCPPCRTITEKYVVTLVTNGPIAPDAGTNLQELLQPEVPEAPKAKFRPVEFPDEVAERTTEELREASEFSPQRDAEHAKNPPAPDAKAQRLAQLEALIRDDMRALGFTRIEILPFDDEDDELFGPDLFSDDEE
jgi:hypothetical protein